MATSSRLAAFAAAVGADIKALFSGKVDAVAGKGLSTNDYTSDDKKALADLVTSNKDLLDRVKKLEDEAADKGSARY